MKTFIGVLSAHKGGGQYVEVGTCDREVFHGDTERGIRAAVKRRLHAFPKGARLQIWRRERFYSPGVTPHITECFESYPTAGKDHLNAK